MEKKTSMIDGFILHIRRRGGGRCSHREGASRKGETRNEMKSSVVVIVDEDSGIKISPDCFRERFAGAGIEPSRSDWACQRW